MVSWGLETCLGVNSVISFLQINIDAFATTKVRDMLMKPLLIEIFSKYIFLRLPSNFYELRLRLLFNDMCMQNV